MTTEITGDEPDLPVIENTPVAARHIVRAEPDTDGAVEVLPGHWWAPAPDPAGLAARGRGWVSASVVRRVRDAGQLEGLVLPNAAGADGTLHRERFATRTDPTYHVGDEWIELVDEHTGEPLIVATPETARVDRTTVNVAGPDVAALLAGFREGKVAPWTPHAPQDVLEWYSHAPHLLVQDAWAGYTSSDDVPWPGAYTPTTTGTASIFPAGIGIRMTAAAGLPAGNASIVRPVAAARPRGWEVTLSVLFTRRGGLQIASLTPAATLALGIQTDAFGNFYLRHGDDTIASGARAPAAGTTAEFRIVARDEWVFFTLDGQSVGALRRAATGNDLASLRVLASGDLSIVNVDLTVNTVDIEALEPFLRRGAPAPDYRVAGIPTPGGLRGDYYITSDEWVRALSNFARYGAQIPSPLAEPYQRRLDPAVAFQASASWMPPGPPSGTGFAVRWSGSIYLDPASIDALRLDTNSGSMARLWVGKTTAGTAMIDFWGTGTGDRTTVRYLADHLGAGWQAGWYPIVLEFARGGTAGAGIALLRWGGSSFVAVPAGQLSPYGCWEGDLGGESYRGAIDSICTTSGLSWRLQPKTLESGEFPGRLEHGARLGQDTDYVLGEDEATEYASEVAAADTIDRIVADAQGLGDNLGREGLSATIVDPAAIDRPWLLTRAETLTDITEQTLLQQRLSTLLALYSGVAETIAARPRGRRTLTDSFPTTGDTRLLLWEPDDALRVHLPSVGVEDRTPRALTTITWPLTPQGRGAPTVGFRQRPRHLRETLRRLQRGIALQRRRYQGQLTEMTGSIGGSGGADAYSRISLPPGRVARLTFRAAVVTSSGTIEVSGVSTGIVVSRPGEYDVTAWLPADPTYVHARLVGGAGAVQLGATVRI